ncbi:ATP-binding protein [Streptomyces profundus]|uniref:ATP-binding protein n=1 Tax=Streptomyces profundus TaxID=2867410 RepID=UPI002ADE0A72|nr:tetratricopeptide repeat protein [Streptomyces sp. MA3_2.13]UED86590.1 tetratricopeptide repeat protein [Streptomyces sp. MA3_2.13]
MSENTSPAGDRPALPRSQGSHSEISNASGNMVQAGQVSGGVHFHATSPAEVPRPAQLPRDARGFVNRERELAVLDAALTGDPAADSIEAATPLRVLAIVGTAGVGKTSLAVRWAHHAQERFPDGQLYVNLRGYDPGPPITANDVLGRFLRALGIPLERVPTTEESRSDLFRTLIAGRRMLLLLDNAATVGQIRPLLPGAPQCLVMITSRTRMSSLVAREGAHRVSVETLSSAEAVQLLRAVLAGYRSGDDEAELAELARLCARLPLALRIVAERAAARPRMPLRDLIRDLRDESGLWDALTVDDGQSAEEADAVRTVFGWSYRALNPASAHLFRLLGLHPGPDFGVGAAAALAGLPPSRARLQLDTLAGAHLLDECGHDRYQFHDLLRAYALDQARTELVPAELAAARRRVLGWYAHTAEAAARAGAGAYTLPVALEPLPEGVVIQEFDGPRAAIAWYETERENLIAAIRIAHGSGQFAIAWQLPAVLTMVIADREPAGTWLAAQETALDAARQAGDRYGEAITLDNLGIAHRHLFQLADAADRFQAALDAFRALNHPVGETRAANGLGVTHMLGHRVDQARACFERALTLARDTGHQTYIGAFTRNVGWALLEGGDLERAETTLAEAADLLSQAGEPLELAEALTLLAAVHRGSARLARANEAAERALALASESDGTLFEALALLELGRIALAGGEATDALSHLHQAATLFQRVGRADLQAAAWDATGEALLRIDRAAEAAGFHQAATAARRRLPAAEN